MNWINILAVFVGSGLGGVCRYLVNKITFTNVQSPAGFPWGTFAVNIAGCFLIGLFSGLFSRYDSSSLVSPQIRLLLTVGFCVDQNFIQSPEFPIFNLLEDLLAAGFRIELLE